MTELNPILARADQNLDSSLEKLFELIGTVVSSRDLTVLLIEQNVADALEMANRAYVIEGGRIAKTGAGAMLLHDPDIQRAYLGL